MRRLSSLRRVSFSKKKSDKELLDVKEPDADDQLDAASQACDSAMTELNGLAEHLSAEKEAADLVMAIKAEEKAKHDKKYTLERCASAENLAKEAARLAEANEKAATDESLAAYLQAEQEAMDTVMAIKAEEKAKHEKRYTLERRASAESLTMEAARTRQYNRKLALSNALSMARAALTPALAVLVLSLLLFAIHAWATAEPPVAVVEARAPPQVCLLKKCVTLKLPALKLPALKLPKM